jgi:hypothetical protein
MTHLDPELLAGVALESLDILDSDQRQHLAKCVECQAEVSAFQRVAVTLQRAELTPPTIAEERVWERIATHLAVDEPPSVPGQPAPPLRAVDGPSSSPSPKARRARPGRRTVLLAAAVGLVVGIGSTVAVNLTNGRSEIVSSTPLVALPGQSGRGTAELVRRGGITELRVQVDATSPEQDYRELWLINTDGKRMYSVGVLPPSGAGSYPIPPQLSGGLSGFTIVDVSIEPYDGNAEHSHNSLVRGSLPL